MKIMSNGHLPVGQLGNQGGSTAYTIFGLLIIAVVVVGAIFFFPWDQIVGKQVSALVEARKALATQQWDKAISLFDKVIKSQPGNTDAYIGRSTANLNIGELEAALKDADQAVKSNVKSAVAYGQRAIVEKMMGKNQEALDDFTKAIEMDAGYAWAFAQRADLYTKRNEQERALSDISQALAVSPRFAEGYRIRAWILSRTGKCKEAFEDFKKVADLRPDDAWSIQDKAWFLMTCPDEKLQDPAKAFELAQTATKLSEGKDAVVQETLAEAYFRQGDPAKAAELQRKAIELKSKSCPSGSCTDEMKERLKKYELAARKEVRTHYEILPTDSSYRP
jgi:tetratricopeptide (TPR) repeat protein